MSNRQDIERPQEAEEKLQDLVKEQIEEPSPQSFGTLSGVFIPTLLTILGVIMYLREGWVVGNAGLMGAWLIILLAFAITGCTGLSLSSVTTNMRIGAGGAFSVISQSLGLEVGGSIGIPLFISQTLAVAMYVFGFRSGWLWIFPDHPPLVVDLITFAAIYGIGSVSAGLAFKVQYVILAVIVCSLISVFGGAFSDSMHHSIQWWGTFPGSPEGGFEGMSFWVVFAVFFPASTGIMAGANMSGDLKNPRKSIPLGTLSAIGLSLVIYLALAYWLARSATTKELISNYTIMIDKALWGPIVLAGLLGATFSSALSSLVGAPRILQALGEHQIVPAAKWFARRSSSGEPRNGMLLSGVLVLAALMLRDLNAIAPLITMFFLITYAMINAVVLLEQSLGLVSFRPLFRIPRAVSVIGALGCLFAMFIVNIYFGILAVAVVLVLHAWLIRRHLRAPFGDVRSGLFVAIAAWAAMKAESLTGPRERAWKADLLVPVEISEDVRRISGLLRDIAYPKGFVRLLGLTERRTYGELTESLPDFSASLQEQGVFSSWTVVDAATFSENLAAGMQALRGAFFKSHILFLRMPLDSERNEELRRILGEAKKYDIGVCLLAAHPDDLTGRKATVAVWLTEPSSGWKIGTDLDEMDLGLLIAYKIKRNWRADLILRGVIERENDRQAASDYLKGVAELARLPNADLGVVLANEYAKEMKETHGDIHILRLPEDPDFSRLQRQYESSGASCLFTMDSQQENALT